MNVDYQDPGYNATLGAEMNDQQPVQDEAMPTSPSNDEMIDMEIRSMILRRKEASRTFFKEKKDKQDKCWNHYKQVYDSTNKESWQSTTFIPASPKVAEVIASNMHSAMLAPENPVEYQERQAEAHDVVLDANSLIAVDMEKSKFKVHWTDFLRSITIIGTGVGKIEYQKEMATINVKNRVRAIPGMDMMRRVLGLPPAPTETITQKQMLVKDYASFKNVDRYDIFPEPGSTDITKDNWIIERGKICNYKLIQLSKDPDNPVVNITQDLLANNPARVKDPDGDKLERESALDQPNDVTAYLDPDQEHELLEYWGPAPVYMIQPELYGDESRKYESVNCWFWLIDGQWVVRKQVTPWRDAEPPYVKGVYIRVPGQWDGIGPLELMLGLQVELNESRNCRQDEINVKLSPPLAVLKDYVESGDWARLVSGPSAIWPFKGIDDVNKVLKKIDLDADLGDSWRGSAEIYNEIQEVTAAVKATLGNDGSGEGGAASTYRGQVLNKATASERFLMYCRMLEITSLSDAYRKYYQRIYQFKDWDAAFKILGEKRAGAFKFIPPEELDLIAKIVPNGVTSMENKGIQLAQMTEEFKMFSQYPWYKQIEAARKMVIQRGQADPDGVIMTDEELQQFNEQKRQLLQQAQTMPGQTEGPPNAQGSPQVGAISGNVPSPNQGLPRPAMPARGPGAASIDGMGRPIS